MHARAAISIRRHYSLCILDHSKMATPFTFRVATLRLHTSVRPSGRSAQLPRQCRALTLCQVCNVAVLPGDGIGPEISKVALSALEAAGNLEGVEFRFTEAHIGGAAVDATGSPLPDETLQICRDSDAVLLAAIGGYEEQC